MSHMYIYTSSKISYAVGPAGGAPPALQWATAAFVGAGAAGARRRGPPAPRWATAAAMGPEAVRRPWVGLGRGGK